MWTPENSFPSKFIILWGMEFIFHFFSNIPQDFTYEFSQSLGNARAEKWLLNSQALISYRIKEFGYSFPKQYYLACKACLFGNYT